MPKRKRNDASAAISDDEAPSDRTLQRQKKLCTQRVATGQKALVGALRLGAGFERQKFSRRRKTAKEKQDHTGVARLDAEYAVLKSLDIPALAEQHLRKTIAKVKSIKDHEALPTNLKGAVKANNDSVTLNVTARLYKVQAVKKAVDGLIDDLKEILGVSGGTQRKNGAEGKEKHEKMHKKPKIEDAESDEEVDQSKEDLSDDEAEDDIFAAFDARIAAPSSAEEDSDDSLSEGDRPPSIAESDESDDEDASELESAEDGSEHSEAEEFQGFSSDSESGIDLADGWESEEDLAPKAKKANKVSAEKATKSTFLPSLSHAGYYSGSESDASDLDIDVAPKKNRRGQRARQKIWEKKFGEKAKHVKQQERNKGWDPKRGAVGDERRGARGAPNGMKTGRGPQQSGENAMPLGVRRSTKRDDTGSLHPSWQAAKAAKEKKMDVKPQGKKVVFD